MSFNKMYDFSAAHSMGAPRSMAMDAASASGMAFLEGELEKLDSSLREPLTSFTYPRDIIIEPGGGWIEYTSAMHATYGISGGSGAAGIGASAANVMRIIQAELSKDLFRVRPYQVVMKVKYVDMQRGAVTGRSLEDMYDTGIRLDFDKYMDRNVYMGIDEYGSHGLLNHPDVTATSAAQNAGATSTLWRQKTPEEILRDINDAIVAAWKAAAYDNAAIPNHILVNPENYAYIATTKVTDLATMTILEYLTQNNIARQKGVDMIIAECMWCEGAGAGSTNRMVVYRNEKRFIAMDLPVPLNRVMTAPNTSDAAYDSLYMANVGEVKVHYTQPIRYVDGI